MINNIPEPQPDVGPALASLGLAITNLPSWIPASNQNELINKFVILTKSIEKLLKSITEYDDKLQTMIYDHTSSLKYIMFDLEATRRERDILFKKLSEYTDGL